jgi:hypothetical protein
VREQTLRTQEETSGVRQAYDQAATHARDGSHWFYVIGALCIGNTLLFFTDSGYSWLEGLAVSGFLNRLARYTDELTVFTALVLDIAFTLTFMAFGFLASKRKWTWTYIVGMSLYVLDFGFAFWLRDWIGLAMHAFVFLLLLRGLQATFRLNRLETQMRQSRVAHPVTTDDTWGAW